MPLEPVDVMKADVWSLGVILVMVIFKYYPFQRRKETPTELQDVIDLQAEWVRVLSSIPSLDVFVSDLFVSDLCFRMVYI